MITLTVIAYNDAPADGTLQVHFDELGGSIGRAETNQLVLPDPERLVSRVAAQVVYRNGSFAIVDHGSNPIKLNGQRLVSGREAPLVSGDRVRISGYEISVQLHATATQNASDPFAGLLGLAGSTSSQSDPLPDPLAKPALSSKPGPQSLPAQVGGIPMDWDPFGTHAGGLARPGAPASERPDALGLDLGAAAPAALVAGLTASSAAPSSLDQLFGLPPASGGDPLANSALDAPMAQPNMAADSDPLRSLQSAPRASAAAQADQVSDLQRPFIPPTIIRPATSMAASRPISGAVMSWDVEGASEDLPTLKMAARPATAPVPPPMIDVTAPAAAAPTARPPSRPADEDSVGLLEAFRRGLNAPALQLPALTPALMELIGQLLHEAVRGTVDLLGARASAKHELRAEATTILVKNNNPLKFSPHAEVALQHLLTAPMRGFIPAVPAMRDAYDDLRAHQFGFVAGMQAVLQAALQRFDPMVLEGQLGDRSLLHSLLPASRNARLWELFTEHYARIRSEATDDFHTVFGAAFLSAYNEHVKQLQAQRLLERSERSDRSESSERAEHSERAGG